MNVPYLCYVIDRTPAISEAVIRRGEVDKLSRCPSVAMATAVKSGEGCKPRETQ